MPEARESSTPRKTKASAAMSDRTETASRATAREGSAARILPAAAESALAEAVEALEAGRLVGMPTETVYGLAADALNPAAVARIFAAKGRPRFNPLIVHVTGRDMAAGLAEIPPAAESLIARFWPGPLTLVLDRRPAAAIAELATAGLPTVALRAPAHPVARELIARLGRPVVAPSANRSGHVSPTTAAHVAADLGAEVAVILDAGPSTVGIESTVVRVEADGRWRLLRPGAVTEEEIAALLGPPADDAPDSPGRPLSPGRLLRHYAPTKPLRIDVTRPGRDEFYIGFGRQRADANLSERGDLTEAAARLFALLREAEAGTKPRIAVAPIPDEGLGRAIRDRLIRAAAGSGEKEGEG